MLSKKCLKTSNAGTREYRWSNIGLVIGERSHDRRSSFSGGERIMIRSVLTFGLLIALCASAHAAKVHHSKPRDSSFVRAKAWIRAFRRSSRTRPRATTFHPGV